MADIFDYLEWRGDVSFEEDPFNEVDNLVLSELAYTQFDGIVTDGFERVSLKDADTKFFAHHSREKLAAEISHMARSPLLMDGMLSGRRFEGTKLVHYVDIISSGKNMQMAALTFLLPDGTAYVAFRGTDSTIVGWKEDFNMSYLPETEGQRSAVRYLNEVGARLRRPLRVGGHSKGGNFAVFSAAFCDRKVQDRIIEVYTNDGPGFRRRTMESDDYKRILPRVTSIVPDTSIIGMLLTSHVKHRIVKSSGWGLSQHDAMTWQVWRNRFVDAEQSDLGLFIKQSQQDWLSRISDEEREIFVNALFSIFEATGMGTFGEMEGNLMKSVERMLLRVKDMPRDRQRALINIAGELLHSGTHHARQTIRKNSRRNAGLTGFSKHKE